MTEQEWLASSNPLAMASVLCGLRSDCCGCMWLRNLDNTLSMLSGQECCPQCDNLPFTYEPLVSLRKLELLVVAHNRYVNSLEPNAAKRQTASDRCDTADSWIGSYRDSLIISDVRFLLRHTAECIAQFVAAEAFCNAARCIAGNLWRPAPKLWLDTDDGPYPTELGRAVLMPTAYHVALSIYENRRFADIGVLADALEEANCAPSAMLSHLHSPGPHVRGCWAVDACIGRT